MDLRRAQHRRRIRGEEGHARAAAEDHDRAALEIFDRLFGVIALAHALDVHGGEELGPDAALGEHVGQREAVHGRGQHTHAVGADTLDLAVAVLDAAPEVAAADDDADLGARFHAALDLFANGRDKGKVIACFLLGGKRLAADLDEDSLIRNSHF